MGIARQPNASTRLRSVQIPAQLGRAALTGAVDIDDRGQVVQPVVGALSNASHIDPSAISLSAQNTQTRRDIRTERADRGQRARLRVITLCRRAGEGPFQIADLALAEELGGHLVVAIRVDRLSGGVRRSPRRCRRACCPGCCPGIPGI